MKTTLTSAGQIWFNSDQAAAHVGAHVQTVLKAAGVGDLHGSQHTKPNGRWRFHRDCIDAWAAGEKCDHQKHLRLADTG